MSLLQALGLPQPKYAAAGIPPGASFGEATKGASSSKGAPKREAVVVEEDYAGSTWDNREISENDEPAWAQNGGGTTPAAAPQGPDNIVVPVSLSIPIGRKFKYVQIDKVKIEGELKLSAPGNAGTTQSSNGVEVPLDKKKLVPVRKFEVDLNKLKDLVLGDVQQKSQQSDWKVDPKLECKLSTEEANVALGITVTNSWYTGSAKFVAVAKSKGKDMEFANFNVSPFGYVIQKREIEIGGTKIVVSGKVTVTVVLKPEWGTIAAEVASKVGRPVLSTLGSAVTMEAAIIAGFASIAAAQIFVFVKSVGEWQDVKACAAAAEKGWLSFLSGFCSAYGVSWPDGGVPALRKAGSDAGRQKMLADLKRAREKMGEAADKFSDEEYVAYTKKQAGSNPNGFAGLVEKMFRAAIMKQFLRAYADEHGDDYQFESNYRALQALI